METIIAYGLIILVLTLFIVLLFFMPEPKSNDNNSDVEKFSSVLPTDFLVFNYFPDTAIRMDAIRYVQPQSDSAIILKTLIDKIEPLKTKGLNKAEVSKYLQPGQAFRFYVLNENHQPKIISDYVVNGENQRGIKNIHVGMITTRYIANTTDNLHLATTSANAGQGSAWLIIHNLTDIPLSLNGGEITVDPKSTTRYLGYLNSGVTLGTYFKDDNGLYPDYQYLMPFNNLYYGVVSDTRQPLSGCLQEEFNDKCEYGQTLWPFEQGLI